MRGGGGQGRRWGATGRGESWVGGARYCQGGCSDTPMVGCRLEEEIADRVDGPMEAERNDRD